MNVFKCRDPYLILVSNTSSSILLTKMVVINRIMVRLTAKASP